MDKPNIEIGLHRHNRHILIVNPNPSYDNVQSTQMSHRFRETMQSKPSLEPHKLAVTAALTVAAGMILFFSFDFSGDFAINDDWGYTTPIRWWILDGQFALTNWQSMPLVTQLALGAAWAEIFGFSQGVLRHLTLVLAIISCLAILLCTRVLSLPFSLGLLCASLPLASPIFVGLSYTFMTDIPAVALVLLSVFFFMRSFNRPDNGGANYWIGVTFLLLAVLLRQTSLALALAIVVAEPVARGFSLGRLVRSVSVVAMAFSLYAGTTVLLKETTGLPATYGVKTDAISGFIADILALNLGAFRRTIEALLIASSQFGLFTLPILPIILSVLWRRRRNIILLCGALAVAFSIASLFTGVGVLASEGGNMLTADGLGPRTIPGSVQASAFVILALSSIGHFGFTCVVVATILSLRMFVNVEKAPSCGILASVLLLALTAIITFAPHTIAYAAVFDRYVVLPSILLVLAVFRVIDFNLVSAAAVRVSAVLVLAGFALSVMLSADYFRWQEARYSLIRTVQSEGIAPWDIDGGFEYNNLMAIIEHPGDAVSMSLARSSYRPVRLTRDPAAGDQIVATEQYTRLFGGAVDTIYAIK